MDVMMIFDVIILVFGAYMVISALRMKKSGIINSTVISSEEIASCKDTAGFIAYIYWKEALFGGLIMVVGILGIVNTLVISLGVFNLMEMLIFLAAFIWFQYELRQARKRFL